MTAARHTSLAVRKGRLDPVMLHHGTPVPMQPEQAEELLSRTAAADPRNENGDEGTEVQGTSGASYQLLRVDSQPGHRISKGIDLGPDRERQDGDDAPSGQPEEVNTGVGETQPPQGPVAPTVERLACTEMVVGSNPIWSTMFELTMPIIYWILLGATIEQIQQEAERLRRHALTGKASSLRNY